MKGKTFTAQEVQAIIAGNKTMFREICKRQPSEQRKPYLIEKTVGGFSGRTGIAYPFGEPSYKVRQKIFVKERWGIGSRPDQFGGYKGFEYKADCFGDNENLPCYEIDYDKLPKNIEIDNWIGNWEQARLMPEWASRLTLEITDIKVERLGEISEEDCHKEGAVFIGKKTHKKEHGFEPWWHVSDFSARGYFHRFWNATHKKPEEKFEANPFVWVVDFKINK